MDSLKDMLISRDIPTPWDSVPEHVSLKAPWCQPPEPSYSDQPKEQVEHHSDVLLHKQIENVKHIQIELKKAINDCYLSNNCEDEKLLAHATVLKERAEALLFLLKVTSKINSELVLARITLYSILNKGSAEDSNKVHLLRQRITWLENRLVGLIGNVHSPITYGDEDFKSQKVQLNQNRNKSLIDSEISQNESCVSSSFGRTGETIENKSPNSEVNEIKSNINVYKETSQLSLYTERTQSKEGQTVNSDSAGLTNRPLLSPDHDKTVDNNDNKYNYDDLHDLLNIPFIESPLEVVQATDEEEASSVSSGDSIQPIERSVVFNLTPRDSENELSETTLKTGTLSIREENDALMPYWDSEHHRFQFSEHVDSLLQLNPLSYHQMGLSLPDTFVKKAKETGTKLPWKPGRKSRDVLDINEKGLEILSLRLHQILKHVHESTLFSLKWGQSDARLYLTSSDFSEHTTKGNNVNLPKRKFERNAEHFFDEHLASSEVSFKLPQLKKKRIGSSHSGRLIFYPKPLPYPKKLPITKTNFSMINSPISHKFSSFSSNSDSIPKRIVDQRNLIHETKFTSSLFKPFIAERKNSEKYLSDSKLSSKKFSNLSRSLSNFRSLSTASQASIRFKSKTVQSSLKNKFHFLDTSLKLERIKDLTNIYIVSNRPEERIDAAKQLGTLQLCNDDIEEALTTRLLHDKNERVMYESAKSLATLGYWKDEVFACLGAYLQQGDNELNKDILTAINHSSHINKLHKKTNALTKFLETLSLLTKNPNVNDRVSFEAAICLGNFGESDENAIKKLKLVSTSPESDVHLKASGLDMIVRIHHIHDIHVLNAILNQIKTASDWKIRKDSLKLLNYFDLDVLKNDALKDKIIDTLMHKSWDEPNNFTRLEVLKTAQQLKLYTTLCELTKNKMNNPNENLRMQAVISVGTFNMKSEKMINKLLEMLDLDSCEKVRYQIIKVFQVLNLQLEKRVNRALKEKLRTKSLLAKESAKILKI